MLPVCSCRRGHVDAAPPAPWQAGGMAEITVRDDADAHRFEALVDGEVAGFTEYHLQGDVQVMPHTVTAPEHRGQGVAGAVVKAALEAAREAGRTVRPDCPYVRKYIEEHAEYQDLLAG
ncbi:GNAT family N-acetyltransferase [Kytococcus sedentarius]|uniref:GNAT family N-acetyltransferase n=1 Tax=Kytococcus sedentarius TaxID=1276 RepID=UPI00384C4955